MPASLQNNKDSFTLYYHTGNYHLFSGRVIGYLDNKQFASVLKNPKILGRKLSTMPPKSFFDLIGEEAVGLRLAFLTKDLKDFYHIVLSDVIKEINSSMSYGVGEISFVDEKQNLFHLETEV